MHLKTWKYLREYSFYLQIVCRRSYGWDTFRTDTKLYISSAKGGSEHTEGKESTTPRNYPQVSVLNLYRLKSQLSGYTKTHYFISESIFWDYASPMLRPSVKAYYGG